MKARKLASEAIRQLGPLSDLESRISDTQESFAESTFPSEEVQRFPFRSVAEARQQKGKKKKKEKVEGKEKPDRRRQMEEDYRELRNDVLRAGAKAIRKVNAEGPDAELEPVEALGLEAIILTEGRPAILIQNGIFFEPPEKWKILNQFRDQIQSNFPSVGRIELVGHPTLEWVGTGFLVADGVIMTNRHVAKEFTRQSKQKWVFEKGMVPSIDYLEELGGIDSNEYSIRSVIGIHDKYDLALLKVSKTSSKGTKTPAPLTISSNPKVNKKQKVYVLGYPAYDSRNGIAPMRKIFSDIYDVKRLQPGEIGEVKDLESLFHHDCSTLGGNSGSCVIDLESNQVIGLHFGGRYLEANSAVALWKLTKDPLLKKGKVNFA